MSVTLHGYWRSSAAYRLRIALNLLNIPFRDAPIDLAAGEHLTPAYTCINPQGLVPSLEIDGQIMTQSVAILEYLNETRSAGFLPQEPFAKAHCRAVAHAIAMEIHPVCNLSVAKYASENSGGAISMKGWMQYFIPKGLQAVEHMIGGAGQAVFCFGDNISMADICLVPQIYNASRWDIDVTSFPQISRIMANLTQVAAIGDAHPDNFKPDTFKPES